MAQEILIAESIRKNLREYTNAEGDLVIARRLVDGEWLVTATISDPDLTQVQGIVLHNEAGFRGRQWESAIDGQQHSSLMEALRAALRSARFSSKVAAFRREQGI